MKKAKIVSWVMMCCLALVLFGCGGGSEGEADNSNDVGASNFISWTGNANGTVVLDGKNNQFQFRASDGSLFDGTTYYNNVENSGSEVLLNGYVIGSITSTTSATGTTIAVLTCTNGSNMIMSGGNISCSGDTNNNSGTGWVTGTYTVLAYGTDSDPLVLDTNLTAYVTTSSGSADWEGQYIKISNWSSDYPAGYSVGGHSGTLDPRESKILYIPFDNGSGSSYKVTQYQLTVQYYKK